MSIKGRLVVTMKFEVPVSDAQYRKTMRDEGEVTVQGILDAEEQNYLANIDTYMDAMVDHISEVSFDFVAAPPRGD